jgi:hypothetical protein
MEVAVIKLQAASLIHNQSYMNLQSSSHSSDLVYQEVRSF